MTSSTAHVRAEIGSTGRRIVVTFPYDTETVATVKTVPGARYTPPDKGGPYWTIPLDLETCRELRKKFERNLVLGPNLIAWGREAVKQEKLLLDLGVSRDTTLDRLPRVLPGLASILRDYQRVGVKFMATSPHPLNADEPRLGKTIQTIAGIFEAGLDEGPHLVAAPSTTLDDVWRKELEARQPYAVFVATGSRSQRERTIEEFAEHLGWGEPGWLVVNPEMVRYSSAFETCDNHLVDEKVSVLRACDWCVEYDVSEYPFLHETDWNTVTIDEYAKRGIRNPGTRIAKGFYDLKAKKRIVLTATPMGGKPINLWGILHFLRPDVFTSKWTWARRWLEITEDAYGQTIGGIDSDKEAEFFKSLAPYMIRRERKDVRPELPDEDEATRECEIYGHHAAQYKEFAAEAEITIENEHLSATSILAEFTRLKQFASFPHSLKNGMLQPIPEGGKLDVLLELLEERGILDDVGREQVVIFSQFSQVIDMLNDYLTGLNVRSGKITGDISQNKRQPIIDNFQTGRLWVVCMTTTTGGYGITLDRANTAIFIDETWDPDDQFQARSRISPVTFMDPKTAYTLRSKDTIESYIADVNLDKDRMNATVLRGIRLR